MVSHKGLQSRKITEENKVPIMEKEEMEKVEEILGYRFKDRGLIEEALTHPSFYLPCKPKATYERLEFIGDAVLNCLVGRWVFSMYSDLAPGMLTRLRAANVDNEKLARVAVCRDLHFYLRHKAPLLNEQIQEFMEGMKVYPNHSNGLLDPPKVLADIVESLLGAIFIDSNSSLETVWKAFKRLAEPLIELEKLGRHPMAELHELCQKKKLHLKFVKDAWAENMNVEVLINGNMVGSATYRNKKEIAMNRAAKSALDRLKDEIMDLSGSTEISKEETNDPPDSANLGNSWTRRLTSLANFFYSLIAYSPRASADAVVQFQRRLIHRHDVSL